jgi:trehalose 6-phosphate synthase
MTEQSRRLVVVSNRVADFSAKFQTGGLAVALADALRASDGLWFGWSGETRDDAASTKPKLEKSSGLTVATIDLTPEEEEGYYLGYANRCLWPALHYRLDLAQCNQGQGEIYFAVNGRFADALITLLRPDDLIWAHDYQLIPLAEELRRRGCTCRIGFFLHTPFPSPEIFAAVPGQKRLGNSLMVYDLIGFQTKWDRDNFRRYVTQYLDGERLPGDRLTAQGQTTKTSVFPIGIDAAAFQALAASEAAKGPLLPTLSDDMQTIIGVDRLDYSKGIVQRLEAFGEFLRDHPEERGRVSLLQIAPPSRSDVPEYADLDRQSDEVAGRLNAQLGEFDWTPIRVVKKAYSRKALAGFYRRAQVGLVTPMRDGMNLVAKEYIAAQDPADPGVLVLSRFAGAAEQLREALLINPHDINETARALDRALSMPRQERWSRHNRLMQRIVTYDLANWRDSFIQGFAAADAKSAKLGKRLGAA